MCNHSAFPSSVSLVISCQPCPPVRSLLASFFVSPVLFSHSLHPWCENHRGLCRLVNTALKKEVWREQQGWGVGGRVTACSKDRKKRGKVKKWKKWAPVSFKLRRSEPEKGLMKGYNQFVSEDVSASLSFVHRRAQRSTWCGNSGRVWVPDARGCTPAWKRLSSARERVTAAV